MQGAVNPDEFYVYKPASRSSGKRPILRKNLRRQDAIKMIYSDDPMRPARRSRPWTWTPSDSLAFSSTDDDIVELAKHGGHDRKALRPADGHRVGQGRQRRQASTSCRPGPETVQSRSGRRTIERLPLKDRSDVVLHRPQHRPDRIGSGQGQGHQLDCQRDDRVEEGDVLVTDMTDPDWEPIMKRASAIVTNRGGRTCHAAIIARELGIPAVVGCGNATALRSRMTNQM